MFKIALGNMPAKATANLRAFCSQKLEVEDESYCFRLPMTYVPAYMGPVSNLMNASDPAAVNSEQLTSVQHVLDVESQPVKTRASGLWDIQVTIKGQG